MNSSLHAMHRTTQEASPHLPLGTAAITIASVRVYDPSDTQLDHATTKAAIVACTEAPPKQMLQSCIKTNIAAPGPFWTALHTSGGQPPEKVAQSGARNGCGRPGQPVALAPIHALLASQDGSRSAGEAYGAAGGEGVA